MCNMLNKVIPEVDERMKAIEKYSRQKPGLKWGPNDRKGVFASGWNPLRGVNISFSDESKTNNRMSFVIELPAPGVTMSGVSILLLPCLPLMYRYMASNAVAVGYFFVDNPVTGKVDLLYRIKPFRGKEHTVIYKDCTYFGLETEKIPISTSETGRSGGEVEIVEESKFIVSNEWQDKALGTGVNFCHKSFADFRYVVEYVNDFIQNSKIEAHAVPPVTRAFPVLRPLVRVGGPFDYAIEDEDIHDNTRDDMDISGGVGDSGDNNGAEELITDRPVDTAMWPIMAMVSVQPLAEVSSSVLVPLGIEREHNVKAEKRAERKGEKDSVGGGGVEAGVDDGDVSLCREGYPYLVAQAHSVKYSL